MATLTTHMGDDHIRVDRPSGESFAVPLKSPSPGNRIEVRLHGATRRAFETSPSAHAWFSEAIKTPCRLVESVPYEDPWRNGDPEADAANTYFPDLYPILLTSEESLNNLFPNGDITMDRFRPNLVVQGSHAFAEDEWESIRIGDANLKLVKPCARCQVTTVDQTTGIHTGPEPLKTLGDRRRWQGKAVFGWNAIVKTTGRIQVGESLEIQTNHSKPALIGPK